MSRRWFGVGLLVGFLTCMGWVTIISAAAMGWLPMVTSIRVGVLLLSLLVPFSALWWFIASEEEVV